jgi:hypothetical protein
MSTNKSFFLDLPPTHALRTVLLLLVAVLFGTGLAIIVLPAWLPALSASVTSPEPKAFWYLSRSSAFVSYTLLWMSMVFGLLMTSKLAPIWPGGPPTKCTNILDCSASDSRFFMGSSCSVITTPTSMWFKCCCPSPRRVIVRSGSDLVNLRSISVHWSV